MEDQEKKDESNTTESTVQSHGPQGVDKAPGEETAQDNIQFTQETQKGKKVDGDPTQESDMPVSQDL